MINTYHIHPMVVHFPIALIIAGFTFDLVYIFYKKEICFSKAGFYLMILGALAAIVAFTTGHLFTSEITEGDALNTYLLHKNGGLFTLIFISLALIVRIYLVITKKEASNFKWLSFILYLMAFLAVSFTGFMGGTMVYEYMLGI
jgi:uncharacterized membrane protein